MTQAADKRQKTKARASPTGSSSSSRAVPCVQQRSQDQFAVPASVHAAHEHPEGGGVGHVLEAGSAGLRLGSRGPAT